MTKENFIESKEKETEYFLEKISELLNAGKEFLDNEYVKQFGQLSKMFNIIRGSAQIIANKKFERFLKGFNNGKPTDVQIKKLANYIDDEKKAEYISDTFSKVLLSNSSKACLLMGSLLHDIVENKTNLSYQDLNCLSALVSFFDYDIDNYKWIFDNFSYRSNISESTIRMRARKQKMEYMSIMLTVEKSVTHHLLIKRFEADSDASSNGEDIDVESEIDEYYVITDIGKKIMSYISRVSKAS
ncbi:hypothetical protein [Virgibacillus dokdonensis]|uniref:Uncharacterized protein n=1 Tax=Virgibacillus dokdonensis TaxID=302167 RepID=A0ABU7VIT7_9BACI